MTNYEELDAKIDQARELYETLPENTVANRKKKVEFLNKELVEAEELKSQLFAEMKKRFAKLDAISENEDLAELKKEAEEYSVFKEWNEFNTPFEKLGLDFYLYQLHRYYKEDLESVNSCLYSLLDIFSNVGIALTPEDFNYHAYASEYIGTIIKNKENPELIHEIFEAIYWKCPEILRILESNFKSLYFRNLKKIEKHFEDKADELSKNQSKTEIKKKYLEIKEKIRLLENTDPYTFIQKVANRDFALSDLDPIVIENKKKALFSKSVSNEMEILEKLSGSLQEYNYFLKYSFIVVDMRDRVNNREQYKGVLANKLKEIEAKEKQLFKLNDKSKKKSIFHSKKSDLLTPEIQQILDNLETLYKELDDIRYNDLILQKLNSDSSNLDALQMASSNYLYFVELIKKDNDGMPIEDINEKYQALENIMSGFNFTILNNVYLLEEKDIAEVISDRYKLLNVTLTKDDLFEENLESFIRSVDTLLFADNLDGIKLTKEDIEFYIEMQRAKIIED